MTPIMQLNDEHQVIRTAMNVLATLRDTIRQQGRIESEKMALILDFFEQYVERIHHHKEEAYLFPELENIGVSRHQGPIGVMLREHETARHLVKSIKHNFALVEKPANRRQVLASMDDYLALLDRHIEKETNVLFQIAVMHLSQTRLETMQANFDKMLQKRRADYQRYPESIERLQATLQQAGSLTP